MSFPDEPFVFPDGEGPVPRPDREQIDIAARIAHLVQSQRFGVLCTQGEGQPYGSLVAYATVDDLSAAVFATPKATRKYKLLSECEHVSLLIDNRPDFPSQLMKVEAVTATGRAHQIDGADDSNRWAELLTNRHPYLLHFVNSASCGLFRVEVVRYFHVCRFQEVRQWIPSGGG